MYVALIERLQRRFLSIIVDDTLRLGDHCDYILVSQYK